MSEISDLVVGQKLEGVVRNVVDFGAFVEISEHEDGLIHISHMSRKFIKHPSLVVAVGEIWSVWGLRKLILNVKVNLSLLAPNETDWLRQAGFTRRLRQTFYPSCPVE